MGRKKRKAPSSSVPPSPSPGTSTAPPPTSLLSFPPRKSSATHDIRNPDTDDVPPPPPPTRSILSHPAPKKRKGLLLKRMETEESLQDEEIISTSNTGIGLSNNAPNTTNNNGLSNYAPQSHSGGIIQDDIYVSDGSEDENDAAEGEEMELQISASKMGVMRRGFQQNSFLLNQMQWTRDPLKEAEEEDTNPAAPTTMVKKEEATDLDPATRAANELLSKKRQLLQAKETARRLESAENAGRDPCLFSKRTAFDIRMDQIEDKPWSRSAGDPTDYFNYGLGEEDWLEYAERQLAVRQELTDANRQKRLPDPSIVPVLARTPSHQAPKVAVVGKVDGMVKEEDSEGVGEEEVVVGPKFIKKLEESSDKMEEASSKKAVEELSVSPSIDKSPAPKVIGGAWGAGAASGSILARLIREQQLKLAATPVNGGVLLPNNGMPPPNMPRGGFVNKETLESAQHHDDDGSDENGHEKEKNRSFNSMRQRQFFSSSISAREHSRCLFTWKMRILHPRLFWPIQKPRISPLSPPVPFQTDQQNVY